MKTFIISIAIEVEAEDYEAACDLENTLTDDILEMDSVLGVSSIDVEEMGDE